MNKKTFAEQMACNLKEIAGLAAEDAREDLPSLKELGKSATGFAENVGLTNENLIKFVDKVEPTRAKISKIVGKLPNEVPAVPEIKAALSLFDSLSGLLVRPMTLVKVELGPIATWLQYAPDWDPLGGMFCGAMTALNIEEGDEKFTLLLAPWLDIPPGDSAGIPSNCVYGFPANKPPKKGPAAEAFLAWVSQNTWAFFHTWVEGRGCLDWREVLGSSKFLGSRQMPETPVIRGDRPSTQTNEFYLPIWWQGDASRRHCIGRQINFWPQGRDKERRLIELSLKNRARILLLGQPGTGKTETALSVVADLGYSPILIQQPTDFLFCFEPPINAVILDDIDRWDSDCKSNVKALLDVIPKRLPIIMTANSIVDLDPALLRPGRIDRIIEFQLPDNTQREKVLRYFCELHNVPTPSDTDVAAIVAATEGLSEAYVAQVIERLVYTPIDILLEDITTLKRIQASLIDSGIDLTDDE